MTLTFMEMTRLFYLSGENATEAGRVYRQNHNLERGPCLVKSVRNFIKKFEETGG